MHGRPAAGQRAFNSIVADASGPGVRVGNRLVWLHVIKDVAATAFAGDETYPTCAAGRLYWKLRAPLLGLDAHQQSLHVLGPTLDFWPYFLKHQLVLEAAAFLTKSLRFLAPLVITCDGNQVATFVERQLASALFKSTQAQEEFDGLASPSLDDLRHCVDEQLFRLTWWHLDGPGHILKIGQVSIVTTGCCAWDLAFMIRQMHSGFFSHSFARTSKAQAFATLRAPRPT